MQSFTKYLILLRDESPRLSTRLVTHVPLSLPPDVFTATSVTPITREPNKRRAFVQKSLIATRSRVKRHRDATLVFLESQEIGMAPLRPLPERHRIYI